VLIGLIWLSPAVPLAALAQTSAPAAAPALLPPDAQAAMKKGLLAAEEQEWVITIQSFQEAHPLQAKH
jgi:hypothetical protein